MGPRPAPYSAQTTPAQCRKNRRLDGSLEVARFFTSMQQQLGDLLHSSHRDSVALLNG